MRQLLIAKKGGSGAILLPRGVSSIEDVPADLASAIEHGYKILDWQENLTEEEMPARWMWHLDWEIEKWFEEVRAVRAAKFGGNSDSDDREIVPMMKNEDPELAKRFGR